MCKLWTHTAGSHPHLCPCPPPLTRWPGAWGRPGQTGVQGVWASPGLTCKTSLVPQLACHQLLRARLPECKMRPTGTANICVMLPGGQALLEGLPSIGSLVLVVATPRGKCVCCLHFTGSWGQVRETVAGRCSEQCLASSQPSVDPGSHLKGQCWVIKSQPVEPNVCGAGSVSQQLLSTNCMPGLELELATGLLGHRAQSCWLRLPCTLCYLFGAQGPG